MTRTKRRRPVDGWPVVVPTCPGCGSRRLVYASSRATWSRRCLSCSWTAPPVARDAAGDPFDPYTEVP